MKRKIFLVLVFLLLLTSLASAHKGRTDANGGHYDYSTGEYHYHHGYPAHQHTNGICPYDFDDQTDHNSGGTSSGISSSSSVSDFTRRKSEENRERLNMAKERETQKQEEAKTQASEKRNSLITVIDPPTDPTVFYGRLLACFLLLLPVLATISNVHSWYKEKKQKERQRLENKQNLERAYQLSSDNVLRLEAENRQLKETVQFLRKKNSVLCDEVYVFQKRLNLHPKIIALPQKDESIQDENQGGIVQEETELIDVIPKNEVYPVTAEPAGGIQSFEHDAAHEFEIEKARFVEMFAGESILDLAGVPQWVEFGPDGLPRDVEAIEDWGPQFTYYVSGSGSCYHCRRGCSGAYKPIHLLQVRSLKPCSRCSPKQIPIDWYDEYLRLKEIKDRYGIS